MKKRGMQSSGTESGLPAPGNPCRCSGSRDPGLLSCFKDMTTADQAGQPVKRHADIIERGKQVGRPPHGIAVGIRIILAGLDNPASSPTHHCRHFSPARQILPVPLRSVLRRWWFPPWPAAEHSSRVFFIASVKRFPQINLLVHGTIRTALSEKKFHER
jgi:hypothetical protein